MTRSNVRSAASSRAITQSARSAQQPEVLRQHVLRSSVLERLQMIGQIRLTARSIRSAAVADRIEELLWRN